jgi:type IV secretion system protein TrbL
MGRFLKILAVLLLLTGVLVPKIGAQALPPPPVSHGQIDQITNNFLTVSQLWEANIVTAATRLFWLLTGIEFTWTAIEMALKGSGIQEFVAAFIRRVMFIGFGLALLTYGQNWAITIVNSFQRIGSQAIQDSTLATGGVGDLTVSGSLTPSQIVGIGNSYAERFIPAIGVGMMLSPGTGLGPALVLAAAALCISLGFALIAIREAMVLCEMYIVLSAGVIFLGFGGSRWTKSYAHLYLKYAVSVGVKLMFMQLVVALSVAFLNSLMIGTAPQTVGSALSIMTSLLVCVVLVFIIPNVAAGLLRGDSTVHGGEPVGMAVSATVLASQIGMAIGKLIAAPATGGGSAAAAAADLKGASSRAFSMAANSTRAGAEGPVAGASGLSGGMGKPPGVSINGNGGGI